MKHSDYLKKKKTRETRKKIISVISAIVVFITTYALVLPAITLDVSRASREPGIAFEQMQFKATASAASVTAADSTVEEVQVEEPAAEEAAEEEIIKEEAAEIPEEETSAVSDENEKEEAEQVVEEAPAESAREEAPAAEAEEVQEEEDKSAEEKADAEPSSEPAQEEAQTAETQKSADQAVVDQSGKSGTQATEAAAAASTEETAAEFQIPTLDPIDFDEILTVKTDFYFYHVEKTEEDENITSDSVDDWKKVSSDTVLAPEDFVRVYLSYEIPAGSLNETNAEARYRLPAGLELSDKQIKDINKYENGIAASKSGREHDKYLGAEAIEGSRTPNEKAGDEYISATVKAEKAYKDGEYVGQDLIFTFIPYTVEKNQISYDEAGKLTSEGRNVKGFFTFDLTTAQIDFEKTEKETVEKEDGTKEEIQYSRAEVVFVKENNKKNIDEISRILTMAGPSEKEEPQVQEPKTLISKGEGNDYTVTVSYTDDAQIPDNAELAVREIEKDTDEYASYLEQAKGAVDENKFVNEARFFDITIVADGEKIEPQAPVNVQITFTGIEQTNTDDTQLLHYKDDKEVEVMDQAEFSKSEEPENETKAVDTVQFETDGFSVYGIVGTEILTADLMTADGKTLKVTVNYDEKAGIPKDAELEVSEIGKDDEGWFERSQRLGKVLEEEYGKVIISDVRFLNIKIMVDGEEFQPLAPVEIKVQYDEEFDTDYTYDYVENELDPKVPVEEPEEKGKQLITVHYGQDGTEILKTQYEEGEGCITESVTSTPSFSDFDFVIISEDEQPEVKESVGGYVAPLAETKAALDTEDVSDAPVLRAAGNIPDHGKDLENKGDGTYDIHLNVTGDADTSSTVSSVNVVVIYDTSTSMSRYYYVPSATGRHGGSYPNYTTLYYDTGSGYGQNRYQQLTNDNYTGTVYSNRNGTVYTGQRWNHQRRADAAEPVVRQFINSLYSYQDPDNPSNIQTSFVTFNANANTRVTWTENATDITGLLTGNGNFESFNSSLYNSGTNWSAALSAANTLVSNRPDNDPTYVIFITDGAPTRGGTGGGTDYENHYTASRGSARSIQQAVDSTGGDFFSIYAYGDEANWLSTLMYYANNGSEPPAGQRGQEFATKGYYTAADTASLTAAIGEIFDNIVETLGVGAVSIEDGTTSEVELSTGGGATADLLDVNTDSFRYTLSWNVTNNGDGTYSFTMPNKTTGEAVVYTVAVSGENITITWAGGSAAYKGNVQFNVLTVDWTEATSFYNFAPPAAQFVDPDVNWNLASVGTLLNGVTYDVAFECYPTQYTLDLIADLKNGYVQYSSLDANIRKYLQQSGDDYVLKTNTGATLYYTDSRTGDGPQSSDYNDPDPQSTAAAKTVAVSKDWSNVIDDRDKPESLTMHVTRDGVDRYELILNDADHWTDDAFISYGIMTIHDGNIVLKTTGHDYSFSEPKDMEYYWELKVPTLRPMLINTVETLLVKVEESEAPAMSGENATAVGEDGYTYYKLTINGTAEYYKIDEAVANLHAENHRRSYLDVVKTVTGTNIPEEDVFPFTITVTNSHAASGTAEDLNSDYWVWFSVYDTINGATVISDDLVSGTGVNRETNASGYTGYYYAPSGTELTVNMQNGYSLRFLNLPTESTYTVTEEPIGADSSYSFVDIEKTRSYKETKNGPWIVDSDYTQTVTDSQSISGTIELTDSAYKTEVTNKYTTVDIQLKKVKEDGTTTISGSTFDLNKFGTSWTSVKTDIKPGDTATSTPNPVDLGGLGIGRYRLTETKAPDGYIILTNHVYFEVYKDTDGVLKARLTDESGAAVTSPTDIAAIDGPGTGDTPTYTLTVENTPGQALPNTGGPGTLPYTLSGIALIMASALMYGFRMRRRERRLN